MPINERAANWPENSRSVPATTRFSMEVSTMAG
jgi:hypothetical protein